MPEWYSSQQGKSIGLLNGHASTPGGMGNVNRSVGQFGVTISFRRGLGQEEVAVLCMETQPSLMKCG